MARVPRPLYMIASGGYSNYESLLASGDAVAMKRIVARSEKWLQDPANADDPQALEETERVQQLKAELAQLESEQLTAAVA